MRVHYADGSFYIRWDRARAWYNPDGTLQRAEIIRRDGKHTPVTERHTKKRAWLEKRGANEAAFHARFPHIGGQVPDFEAFNATECGEWYRRTTKKMVPSHYRGADVRDMRYLCREAVAGREAT